VLQLRSESRIHHSGAQQFRRFDPIHRRRDRIRVEGGKPQAIAEAIAPANYLNAPPVGWARVDRHMRMVWEM
jgi:hypothetical protein